MNVLGTRFFAHSRRFFFRTRRNRFRNTSRKCCERGRSIRALLPFVRLWRSGLRVGLHSKAECTQATCARSELNAQGQLTRLSAARYEERHRQVYRTGAEGCDEICRG